jgi:hypothetical protein
MSAPKKSLRPKSRGGLGLRPKSREEGLSEKANRESSVDFGDTEFRWDLDNQLSWNPLARLGFDPDKGKTGKVSDNAFYGAYVPETTTNIGEALEKSKSLKDFAGRVNPDDVFLSTTIAEGPIWSHEYTHRGIAQLKKRYKEDPEGFQETYGKDTVNLLERLSSDKKTDERATELLDDLTTKMTGVLNDMSQTQDTKFTDRELRGRESIQSRLKDSRVSDMWGLAKFSIDEDARLKGFSGLLLAAEDILKEKGEPPVAEKPGFFKRLFDKVGFAEGGVVEDNPIFKHHQKNVDEGTYVKNEDGSISTVYTTIMGDGEYEYLIPQVWDGKILSEDEAFDRAMSSGVEWPKAPAGEDGVRELEDLDKKLHEKMQGFAKGGKVKSMEEQMNLFEYGGLADDGMDIEPVTGNEVPPGSMAKEVRDDVPAMLSEGEYVVPADVVRYYGIKFFEDLRSEAKSGMVDMEENGRIGGAAVDSNGIPIDDSEELTPEEMAMLEEALAADSGMAMGGLATNQQPPQDPYQQQQTMYTQQYASGGVVKGYAPGGDVTKPTFTYGGGQSYPMGNPYGGGGAYSSTGGFEARTYVNETTGQTRTFQFLNGQPISYIPPGFVPMGQAETTKATADNLTSTATTTQQDRLYDEGAGDGKDAPDLSYDITSLTEAELENMANPNSLENTIAKGIFGMTGPIGAILGQIGAKARANQAKNELARRAEINQQIKEDVEEVLEGLKNETQPAVPAPTGTPAPSDTNIDDPTVPSSFNYSDDDTVMSQPISQQPSFFAAPNVPDITVSTLSPAPPGLPSMPMGGVMPDNPAPPGLPSGSTTTPPNVGTPTFAPPQAVPSLPSEPTFTGFPDMDFGIPGLGNPTAPTAQEQAFSDAFSNISMGETFSGDGRAPDYAGTPGYGLRGGPTLSGQPAPTNSIGLDIGGKSPTFGLSNTGGGKATDIGLNYSGIMSGTGTSDRAGFDMGDVAPGTPSSTAANAPGATANIGGRDVSIGYGAGQVDPGLAAAAAAAERGGGSDGPSGPSGGGTSGGGATGGGGADSGTGPSGGNASPGASGVGAPGVAGGEVGAGPGGTDAVGPMAKGGLVQRKKKKRKGLGGRP